MMNSGTVMTVNGTISVVRMPRKIRSRPGKRRRASEYAAMEWNSSASTVTTPATSNELSM